MGLLKESRAGFLFIEFLVVVNDVGVPLLFMAITDLQGGGCCCCFNSTPHFFGHNSGGELRGVFGWYGQFNIPAWSETMFLFIYLFIYNKILALFSNTMLFEVLGPRLIFG
jgi:hypothetical protein